MYHALKLAVVCLPAALFGLGGEAKAATLFVADNEPGDPFVGELDTSSGLSGFVFGSGFSVPGPINGISPGPNGQVFAATDNHIYDYTSDGALLGQFRKIVGFGALGDLAFDGTTLFVADNEPGDPIVGELDTSSGLSGFVFARGFSVPGPINGISLGPNGQVCVPTDNHIYDYTSDGALLGQFRKIVGFGALGDLAFDGAGSGTTVPEPSTAFLLIIGLFAVAASSRSWWPFKAASSSGRS